MVFNEALRNPELMREYRRGIMLSLSGSWQTLPLYKPTELHPNVSLLGIQSLIDSLPIKPESPLTVEIVKDILYQPICGGEPLELKDEFKFGKANMSLLETEITGITREYIPTIDTTNDPTSESVDDPILKAILKDRASLNIRNKES